MFASDGVGIVGGVNSIGMGSPSPVSGNGADIGSEPSRRGVLNLHEFPARNGELIPGGNFRPMLQSLTERFPMLAPNERAPGLSGIFGNAILHLASVLGMRPEPTRKNNIPTTVEQKTWLSGLPYPSSESWEKAGEMGIDFGEGGNFDSSIASNVGPSEVMNQGDQGKFENASEQVQDFMTNEHDMLMAFKTSFPSVPVQQAETVARSVVLQKIGGAGNFVGEMDIPDGTVALRITWTGMRSGTDLWVNFGGAAFIPTATNQPGVLTASGGPTQANYNNDGVILNPDDTKKYLVKGKRAVGFQTTAVTTVNIQCYQQA